MWGRCPRGKRARRREQGAAPIEWLLDSEAQARYNDSDRRVIGEIEEKAVMALVLNAPLGGVITDEGRIDAKVLAREIDVSVPLRCSENLRGSSMTTPPQEAHSGAPSRSWTA